jgi:hypothetical protein
MTYKLNFKKYREIKVHKGRNLINLWQPCASKVRSHAGARRRQFRWLNIHSIPVLVIFNEGEETQSYFGLQKADSSTKTLEYI